METLLAVVPTIAVAFVAIWEKFMPDNLSILALLGRRINKDALAEIATIKKDLQEHKVDDWRNRILKFENSQRNNRKHTKEEFIQVIKICNKYEQYISKNNLENSIGAHYRTDHLQKNVISIDTEGQLKDDKILAK